MTPSLTKSHEPCLVSTTRARPPVGNPFARRLVEHHLMTRIKRASVVLVLCAAACGNPGGARVRADLGSVDSVGAVDLGSSDPTGQSCRATNGQMMIDSFDGPVTANEIACFKAYITTLQPATDSVGNNWAQGHSGEETKAMGLMFAVSGDLAILDKMLGFCDAVLSLRNDLAPPPVGQHVLWTGRIDPAWPNDPTATPIATGGEQGDPVGHLGNCARLILETPAIWNSPVRIGDPKGYGATYLERAKKYVTEADFALDGHILRSLVDLSNQNHQYFAAGSPYMGGAPVPWNQQMMFNYGLQNLAAAHAILADDPARTARYDAIVQASLDWFFQAGSTLKTDAAGNPAYDWAYTVPSSDGEDSNHGSLDAAGFARAYASGRFGLTAAKMAPFANMFVDIMTIGPRHYAGRVNGTDGTGHASPTTSIRSGYLLLAEFRPNAYPQMMSADFTVGGTTGSIDGFSRFAWVKNRRAHAAPQ
jgi:hypothetical protein